LLVDRRAKRLVPRQRPLLDGLDLRSGAGADAVVGAMMITSVAAAATADVERSR
jgi:hypothetical protein